MSLYSYTKDDHKNSGNYFGSNYIILRPESDKFSNVNIWSTGAKGYEKLEDAVNYSKLTNILIPLVLMLIGSFFIFKHISPEIKHQIEKQNGLVSQGTVSLVDEGYIDISKYVSNPAGKLAEVSKEAFKQNVLLEDQVSRNFTETFYITIPSLGIDRLPVQPNVDSTSEDVYNQVLNTKLAHFRNTGLPISDVKNNIVIYGHSASPNYNPSVKDPMVAFSFLANLKVGDDIFIDISGQRFHYKMQKSRIVEPTETSIITGTPGKRTLTLFTCYPSGNDSQRYVAVAREV